MSSISLPALSGLKILDFSRVRAGPTCVRMFADFGADVIRIEPPPLVDPNAAMFAEDRLGSDFQNLNRNKRSLTLNLKSPVAPQIISRLVKTADLVVENWRPDVKNRLNLDYKTLSAINPRLILASISGYGQAGPYVARPAFDQIIQGLGGLMSVTGLPGQGPVRAGIAVSDSSSGLYAAIGILIALYEREKSGRGQWIQVSLLHSLIAMMDFQIARYINEQEIPKQEGNNHPTTCPMGLFAASDGDFNIGVAGDGMWGAFCKLMNQPQWYSDERFKTSELRSKNRTILNDLIQQQFRTNTMSHWVDLMNKHGIPAGPVHNVPDALSDPQVKHLKVETSAPVGNGEKRHFVTQPIVMTRTPQQINRGAPGLGEHTDEILIELGYTPSEIKTFHHDKAV